MFISKKTHTHTQKKELNPRDHRFWVYKGSHAASSFQQDRLHLQECCVAAQRRKPARPLRGGAVIVTVRCRITALEQVVIRVAEV